MWTWCLWLQKTSQGCSLGFEIIVISNILVTSRTSVLYESVWKEVSLNRMAVITVAGLRKSVSKTRRILKCFGHMGALFERNQSSTTFFRE